MIFCLDFVVVVVVVVGRVVFVRWLVCWFLFCFFGFYELFLSSKYLGFRFDCLDEQARRTTRDETRSKIIKRKQKNTNDWSEFGDSF